MKFKFYMKTEDSEMEIEANTIEEAHEKAIAEYKYWVDDVEELEDN